VRREGREQGRGAGDEPSRHVWLGLFAAVAILIWLEARGCERVSLAGTIICAQNVDPARLKIEALLV